MIQYAFCKKHTKTIDDGIVIRETGCHAQCNQYGDS